ncbi:hypothetical protein M2323_004546 [Rhodoblastus acidophilus]|uniref:hypothetical protein n=1 Tax=Rhodoblastus acidophilus TaxID=1074 RepID=UPI002224C47E|nr:hypothetical protein [Rhodoblastus acidophilus]MCW2286756.1 hypothetical protein [Rhodoblastus acidophilus]MCW2335596.1 hypothetical protein [Rhodoblastus acidophilus]
MLLTPRHALDHLLSQPFRRLDDMPDAIGLYGLGDHSGVLHYVGMTDSDSFRDRIWNRHIAGSEDRSHKLACNYSVGRLWHDRKHPRANERDGAIARRVRQAFIRKHCGFVCLPLKMPKDELRRLEKGVIDLAWPDIADWNKTRKRVAKFEEPFELVNEIIRDLKLSVDEIAALDRQNAIYLSLKMSSAAP